uniref:Uncharacterized protein n=1 Tax=Ditylenchus dipsaci TaxID=166011 RepID=A0A915DHI6_9BILA
MQRLSKSIKWIASIGSKKEVPKVFADKMVQVEFPKADELSILPDNQLSSYVPPFSTGPVPSVPKHMDQSNKEQIFANVKQNTKVMFGEFKRERANLMAYPVAPPCEPTFSKLSWPEKDTHSRQMSVPSRFYPPVSSSNNFKKPAVINNAKELPKQTHQSNKEQSFVSVKRKTKVPFDKLRGQWENLMASSSSTTQTVSFPSQCGMRSGQVSAPSGFYPPVSSSNNSKKPAVINNAKELPKQMHQSNKEQSFVSVKRKTKVPFDKLRGQWANLMASSSTTQTVSFPSQPDMGTQSGQVSAPLRFHPPVSSSSNNFKKPAVINSAKEVTRRMGQSNKKRRFLNVKQMTKIPFNELRGQWKNLMASSSTTQTVSFPSQPDMGTQSGQVSAPLRFHPPVSSSSNNFKKPAVINNAKSVPRRIGQINKERSFVNVKQVTEIPFDELKVEGEIS